MTIFSIYQQPSLDLGDTERDPPYSIHRYYSRLELAEDAIQDIIKEKYFRIHSDGLIIREIEIDTNKPIQEYRYNVFGNRTIHVLL